MAKRVFFSFHYQDVATFRANVVRQHWRLKPDRGESGFFDASIWESAKKESDLALKRLINSGLDNTSVTCVLIGTETYKRRWVRYEIIKSYDKGNSLVGVHINGIKDKNQQTFYNGKNPFDYLGLIVSDDGKKITYCEKNEVGEWIVFSDYPSKSGLAIDKEHWGKGYSLSQFYSCYDWVTNDGYNNFSNWIEK